MGHGIFIHRSDSIYADSPAEHYQFPRQYLSRVRACVGDWVIYYEPRKAVATRGYFGIAKVECVIPDPTAPGMYHAIIADGTYLDFASPVPFKDDDGMMERGLLNQEGRISGRAQAAVRPLSRGDFDRILERGLSDQPLLPRVGLVSHPDGFSEDQAPFNSDEARTHVTILSSRVLRDRVFRRVVLRAYDERCVFSGLKLINGGGRAEVAAAHIRPVQEHGPDIVTNGLALSGTAHWMFDRGLISLSDDLRILISRQANDPDAIRAFVMPNGFAATPRLASDRPHPHFLKWHRDYCFKQ